MVLSKGSKVCYYFLVELQVSVAKPNPQAQMVYHALSHHTKLFDIDDVLTHIPSDYSNASDILLLSKDT